jgi:hypothetical protein
MWNFSHKIRKFKKIHITHHERKNANGVGHVLNKEKIRLCK